MDSDERDIFQFLKTWGADFINAREIARRAASKKKFYEDPEWARPILRRMEERGILESDIQGRYRIKPLPKKRDKHWVAPDIAKILKESGVEVESGGEGDIADDEYYEQL
jgi:predicted transcriptional regulator of viral defense system